MAARLSRSADHPAPACAERPILFSAPMVRAILDGRKTQTRRVCKHLARAIAVSDDYLRAVVDRCPYGKPGDRLWVKETWQPLWAERDKPPPSLKSPEGWAIGYVATDGVQEYSDPDDGLVSRCKPAIFMPRWASRITLEITAVHVERLQDIGLDDVFAELGETKAEAAENHSESWEPYDAFADLWDSINGKRPGCAWADNPWPYVLTFKRLS